MVFQSWSPIPNRVYFSSDLDIPDFSLKVLEAARKFRRDGEEGEGMEERRTRADIVVKNMEYWMKLLDAAIAQTIFASPKYLK